MNRAIAALGPVWVLYLLAEVASGTGHLGVRAAAIAVTAFGLSLAPAFVARKQLGSRRVGSLGVALGTALVPTLGGSPSLLAETAGVVGAAVASALAADLSLSVPDAAAGPGRSRGLRPLVWTLAVTVGGVGLVAALPSLPHSVAQGIPSQRSLGEVALLVGLGLTLGIRLTRRWSGTSPEALAANAWSLGATAIAGVALLAGATARWSGSSADWAQATATAGLAVLMAGHIAMVDPRRRVSAGPSIRRVAAVAATVLVVAAIATWALPKLPTGPLGTGLALIATLLLATAVHRTAVRVAHRVLSPYFGQLLEAVEQAHLEAGNATTAEELGRAVLGPVRRGSGLVTSEPVLYLVTPDRIVTIDAAGEPKTRRGSMPESVARHLDQHPGKVIVAATIARQVVRRPDLRTLVDSLEQRDALVIVPLNLEGEIEGALLVPRGSRSTAVTLEEIRELNTLGLRLGRIAALLSSRTRAHERAARLEATTTDLREQVESLEEQLARTQADARTLKAGPRADQMIEPPIAYGPAMRDVLRRADRLAPVGAPVLLLAEAGTALEPIAYRIHVASGRSDRPFVVGDCGAVRAERLASLLFGDGSASAGWLRSADAGTLLLLDVPALPHDLQHELAEVIATHRLRDGTKAGTQPTEVRIVATSRVALKPLLASGTFDGELARWLQELQLTVPPLRNRPEDLESNLWLAIDRACRRLGRAPIGIESDATDALAKHDWPGNVRELENFVERAVLHARGPKIALEDLPPLVGDDAQRIGDPLECTYQELERRMLVRALERADQNKSEAARLLGLKRSTFLDKLRRQGLYTPDTLVGRA